MPIKLGAGASAGGGVAGWADGTFPPLTTMAGASGCSSSATGFSAVLSAVFSETGGLAGAGAAFADFVDPALGRECSEVANDVRSFSDDALAVPSVISGCETGAEVVAVIVVAGWAVLGFDDSEAETGVEVAADCDDELDPFK